MHLLKVTLKTKPALVWLKINCSQVAYEGGMLVTGQKRKHQNGLTVILERLAHATAVTCNRSKVLPPSTHILQANQTVLERQNSPPVTMKEDPGAAIDSLEAVKWNTDVRLQSCMLYKEKSHGLTDQLTHHCWDMIGVLGLCKALKTVPISF